MVTIGDCERLSRGGGSHTFVLLHGEDEDQSSSPDQLVHGPSTQYPDTAEQAAWPFVRQTP